MERIGTVHSVMRYPVKGMKGEEMASTHVGQSGIPLDRAYFFAKPGATGSPSSSSVNIRDFPGIVLFEPVHVGNALMVRTPGGGVLPLKSEELSAMIEAGMRDKPTGRVQLRWSETGHHDSSPVSIFSMQTLTAFRDRVYEPLPNHHRFRANLYVSLPKRSPFYEHELVGSTVAVGGAVLRVTKKNIRCKVINVNPDHGKRDLELMPYLRCSGGAAGIYANVVTEGQVKPGDAVSLL